MSVNLTVNDQEKAFGTGPKSDAGYMVCVFSETGNGLSGGTLRFFATIDGVKVAIPNSKINAAKVDDNGDRIYMIMFSAAGNISVQLTDAGASPNVTVALA